MMVVAIVGCLAVLATYSVRKTLANSKTAEARNSLGQMSADAARNYENENMTAGVLAVSGTAGLSRTLCGSASKPVPSTPSSIKGEKYQSAPGEWNVDAAGNSGFACLMFALDAPQYYMYSYASQGGGTPGALYYATASGDLNGDQVMSTFQITGQVNSSYILNVAPNMLEVRPEE